MRLKISKGSVAPRTSKIVGLNIRTDFPFQNRPKFTDSLRFPDDLTSLDAANISELLGKYTKLYVYANQNACAINVALLRLDTRESLLRNSLFRNRPSLNNLDRWRRDAVISEDSQMERIVIERNSLLEKKELIQNFLTTYDRYVVALSRELSRKTSERDFPRRA